MQISVALLAFVLGTSPAMPSDDPPATKSAVKIYDETADAKEQIAAALAKAKTENRRVLIQWGGNWCPWCVRLHELYRTDESVRRELLYEYDLVFIDAGKPAGKNVELAKSYGADLNANGYPYLTILNADGKPLANQETGSLEVKGGDGKSAGVKAGHDPAAIMAMLKKYEATHQNSKSVFDAGIAKAKSEGKTAFVHFGAPWCGWCHKLEGWMARPEVLAILAKDFVDLKIDTDRMTGGQAMLDEMSHKKSGGIPWIVFVDGAGKPQIDSNGVKGNIGFPGTEDEIAHFGAMLNKVRRNMTPADVNTLLETLRAKGS